MPGLYCPIDHIIPKSTDAALSEYMDYPSTIIIYKMRCPYSQFDTKGANLLAAADIFPCIRLHGLDWAVASTKIVELLAQSRNLDLHAHLFDMFAPDENLPLCGDDAVLTIGALEQLGTRFEDFLSFLLRKGPRICLHCETMNEIYDRRTVTDYAAAYSKTRNYLWGFLGRLRQLEAQGRIRILQTQRVFGGQFHEGYSFVVWSPIVE